MPPGAAREAGASATSKFLTRAADSEACVEESPFRSEALLHAARQRQVVASNRVRIVDLSRYLIHHHIDRVYRQGEFAGENRCDRPRLIAPPIQTPLKLLQQAASARSKNPPRSLT